MRFNVRFTEEARDDLARLYDGLLQRAGADFAVAERALQFIGDGIAVLEVAPLSCRKVRQGDPFQRELVIGFGQVAMRCCSKSKTSRRCLRSQ